VNGLRTVLQIPIALFCVAVWASASSADTYPRQAGVDILHYLFKLDLADDSDVITGESTIGVRFALAGTTSLVLDLASLSTEKGMRVTGVTSSGKPCLYEHKENRLRISLDPASQAGEQRSFTVSYRGVPRAGLRIGKNRHGQRTFFSNNWPDHARQWLPMVDHPFSPSCFSSTTVAATLLWRGSNAAASAFSPSRSETRSLP
jgi:aminopeptidase N